MSGLATIRAFGWSAANQEIHNDLLDASQEPAYLLAMVQQWLASVLDFTAVVLAVLITTLAVNLRTSSEFTGVALISVVLFTYMIRSVVTFWTTAEICIGAVSRIEGFSKTVKPENLAAEIQLPPKDWPQRGKVEFESISASYE